MAGKNANESEIPKKIEGVHITISGIHDEDEFVKDIVRKEVVSCVRRLSRMAEVTEFSIHVRKDDVEGSRARYSVNGKVTTDKGTFFSDESEWNLKKAVKVAVERLQREVNKEEEKSKVHARAP